MISDYQQFFFSIYKRGLTQVALDKTNRGNI